LSDTSGCNHEAVPEELKALPRWLCWRYEERDGKLTKVPYDVRTGRKASSTDPATWTDFETALATSGAYDGIGIVLGDGLAGMDLDNSVDESGTLKPWAREIVDRLDSYTERSPSGQGVKVILRGALKRKGNRRDLGDGHVEVYSADRYFTVTGNHLPGTPEYVQERQAALDDLHLELFPPKEDAPAPQPKETLDLSDRELLERMFSAANGGNVRRLWEGDVEGYPSHSEADAALCAHLAFWTGADRERIDRLFRQSGLCRDKWTDRPDYRERTISKALEGMTDTYEPLDESCHGVDLSNFNTALPYEEGEGEDDLLQKAFALADELKENPDVRHLHAAVGEYLYQLPDLHLDEVKVRLSDALGESFKVRSFDRAIKAERAERKRRKHKAAKARRAAAGDASLRNYEEIEVADKNGNLSTAKKAIPILHIRLTLTGQTDDWPRRVGDLLFVDESGTIRYLETSESAFAWFHERFRLYWAPGQDVDGKTLLTKGEFACHLEAVCTDYDAVEDLPHEPEMQGHYYAWQPPDGYEPTGKHLDGLLAFFDNPETEADRVLIRAAFLTPAWGGLPGKRPAFAVLAPDRGCGKSTLASVIGQLYGNPIELSITDTAEDKLVSRLLTPEALTKRVVRIDNIKGSYDSAFVEALITSPVISGHRLYHGEASRPNTLTFVLTGNSLRLSRDIADRAFIIRLARPIYRPEWEDELYTYLVEHRDRILADVVAELRKPGAACFARDRYAEWVKDVLARAGGDTDAVVSLNKERRGECDEELEEAGLIMEAIDEHIARIRSARIEREGRDGDPRSAFITSTEMTELLRDALKETLSARAVKQRLERHIEAGRLPRVQYRRSMNARGYDVEVFSG